MTFRMQRRYADGRSAEHPCSSSTHERRFDALTLRSDGTATFSCVTWTVQNPFGRFLAMRFSAEG